MKTLRLFPAAALAAALVLVAQGASAKVEIPRAAQPQLAVATDGRVWLVFAQSDAAIAPREHSGGHSGPGASHSEPSGEPSQHAEKKGGHGTAAAKARPEGSIFVACSNDGGATFSAAVKAGSVSGLMVGMRRGPRIAAHGDRVTVTFVGEELTAFSSSDAGKTWSGPVQINDHAKSAREGLHDLACAPDGGLFVTWLDMRNGRMELWGATSKDGGRTWEKNEQVYRSSDQAICECCHPTALFDAEGNLAVMWRNSIAGSRDMWMTTRPGGSAQFAPARKIGDGTWKLNACPMDGGKIVALGGGRFASVWQRAGEVYFAPTNGPEVLLGKGKQPVGISIGSDTLVFWQQGNDLVSLHVGASQRPVVQAKDARFPVVVGLPGNRGIILAYEQGPAGMKQPGLAVERL